MTDVPGVTSAVPPQEPTQVNSTDATQGTIPIGSGTDQLPKPVLDAILQSIAQQICSRSQDSTERIKKALRDAEEK